LRFFGNFQFIATSKSVRWGEMADRSFFAFMDAFSSVISSKVIDIQLGLKREVLR
jgi:hypothetical protein